MTCAAPSIAELAQSSTSDALASLVALSDAARAAGDDAEVGRCSYAAARVAVNLGRLDDALALIDAARDAFSVAGAPVDAARTDLGRMHVLDDLGRHHDAIEVGRELLAALPALQQASDDAADVARLEAAVNENLGVGSGYLGHHDEALAAYEHAGLRYAQLGLDDERVRCTANRGVELIELGRADDALDPLGDAETAFMGQHDRLAAAKCAAYIGRAHLMRGDFLASIDAIARAERLLAGEETTTEYARTQLVRAETLAALNLVREADELYQGLAEQFERAGLAHDHASAIAGRAHVLRRARRTRVAAPLYEQAELGFARVGDRALEAVCQVGRSFCVAPADARPLVERALATLSSLGRTPDALLALIRLLDLSPTAHATPLLARCEAALATTELPELRWQVDRHRARVRAWRGDLPGALDELARADHVIEQLRTTVTDEAGRTPFLGTRRAVHDDILDLLLRSGDTEAAFARTARARARTLVERTGRSPDDDGDPARGAAVGAGQLLLVYEIIGDEVVLFSRAASNLTVHRAVTSVETIERLGRRLDAEWRRFDDRGFAARHEHDLQQSTLRVLRALYDELLLAAAAELEHAASITIVPIGPLARIPFHALHDGASYLLERATVTFAASPVSDTTAPCGAHPTSKRLLVGVPDVRAPRIADEIEAIAASCDESTVLLGTDATTGAFVTALRGMDVVHVACHGVNRPDNPALSGVRLADRWLTALEIAELTLDGPCVVLSACASGRQDSLGNHDEMVGLPRAFLAAGARDVVVNLWRADDDTASELMVDVHRHLDDGSPASAVRAAQSTTMRRRPHPFFWAPTITYRGLPRPTTTSTRRSTS